jgi:hypothetical protein
MKILWDAKIWSVLNFKNDVQTLNILLLFLELIFKKNKNYDLKSSKHSKYLYPTRFSYKKFNDHNKLNFEIDLMYFFSLAHERSL